MLMVEKAGQNQYQRMEIIICMLTESVFLKQVRLAIMCISMHNGRIQTISESIITRQKTLRLKHMRITRMECWQERGQFLISGLCPTAKYSRAGRLIGIMTRPGEWWTAKGHRAGQRRYRREAAITCMETEEV